MSRKVDNIDIYYNSIEYFQKLEKSLATKLGLSDLKSGSQVVRDKNGWRENEKSIEYIWIVQVSRSFVGWGGLFSIKFNENNFREHKNKEELIQGVYSSNKDGIDQIYYKTMPNALSDFVECFKFDLLEVNKDITLDGTSYSLRVITTNGDTFMLLNNPNTSNWRKLEQEVRTLGQELADESSNPNMIKLFE